MSQVPAAGEQVRSGWRVRVAESMGPQRVVIPDLVGESERAAEINIRRRGLEMGTVAAAGISGTPPDEIAAQSPPANATNVSSPKVSLSGCRSRGPQFVCHARPARAQRGRRHQRDCGGPGLKVGSISTQENASGLGDYGTRRVIRTVPAAGQRIYDGQSVGLVVTP